MYVCSEGEPVLDYRLGRKTHCSYSSSLHADKLIWVSHLISIYGNHLPEISGPTEHYCPAGIAALHYSMRRRRTHQRYLLLPLLGLDTL